MAGCDYAICGLCKGLNSVHACMPTPEFVRCICKQSQEGLNWLRLPKLLMWLG